MVNRARGEAALEAGGRQYRLLLTLGALAEIEDGLGLDDLGQVGGGRGWRIPGRRIWPSSRRRCCAAAGMRCVRPKCCGCPATLGALMRGVTAAFEAAGLAPSAVPAREAREDGPFPGAAG